MGAAAHLFTYGTLVFPAVLEAVAGRAFASVPATLSGFARVSVRRAVYPAAREQAGGSITGVLYLDVDAAALARLDRFEGAMYARREVVALRDDGSRCPAQVYVVAPGFHDQLGVAPWDLERFRREHLDAYLARCRAGRIAAEYEA